jgi:hypothetical protein
MGHADCPCRQLNERPSTTVSSDIDFRYLPSANATADRIFSAPRKRPEVPSPEGDLQCINPAGLGCIHERNRAATSRIVYLLFRGHAPKKNQDLVNRRRLLRRRFGTPGATPHPIGDPAAIAASGAGPPPETASGRTSLLRNPPTNPGEFQAETSSRLIRTSVT